MSRRHLIDTSIRLLRTVLFVIVIACSNASWAQNSAVEKTRRQADKSRQKIEQTNARLTDNRKRVRTSLNRLDALGAQLAEQESLSAAASARIDSLNAVISLLQDTIAREEESLRRLQSHFRHTMERYQHISGSQGITAYVFSSENFAQALQRMSYIRRVRELQTRRSQQIAQRREVLRRKIVGLDTLQRRVVEQRDVVEEMRVATEGKKREVETLVTKLQREGTQLQKALNEERRRAKALDNELERLIAQQQKEKEKAAKQKAQAQKSANQTQKNSSQKSTAGTTASNTSTSGNSSSANDAESRQFEAQQGRLQWPVGGSHKVVRGFGRQKHPTLPNVETNNSGVDIAVREGDEVRAIYGGEVTGVFRQSGFGTIVMVRHGHYLSIYANLGEIRVRKGDHVDTGTTLGRVATEDNASEQPTMHFELRHEREKLNPLQWLRK